MATLLSAPDAAYFRDHPSATESMSLGLANGYEGTRTLSGSDVFTLNFSADGKVTSQAAGSSTVASGTWALQSNDSQLVLQNSGSTAQTYQVFELTASKLSYGVQYDPYQKGRDGAPLPQLMMARATLSGWRAAQWYACCAPIDQP